MTQHTSDMIHDYSSYSRKAGYTRNGRREVKVSFTETFYQQIVNEAKKRNWSIARMIRHLCEASIEGIE